MPVSNSLDKRKEIRDSLMLKDKDILFVAGSTNKGEEEGILDCFSRLKKEHPYLRLLVAPRHIERVKEIEGLLAKKGLRPMRYSKITAVGVEQVVFILDVMGELKRVYTASDVVFVGGSLIRKRGGQNPIEPASLSKPIITGNFMANYQDLVKVLLDNKAMIQVKDKDGLYSACKLLLDNPEERRRLGINAKKIIDMNSGSSQRAVDLILSHLKI